MTTEDRLAEKVVLQAAEIAKLRAACQEVKRWIECDTLVDLDELSDDCKRILGIVNAALEAK